MLNVKALLTKILDRTGVETFTCTAYSGFANSTSNGVYDKASGTVRIFFNLASTSNLDSSVVLFTVPSAYRPSSLKYGSAFMGTDLGYSAINFSLNSNGEIKQTSSGYMRALFGFIEYKLGGG